MQRFAWGALLIGCTERKEGAMREITNLALLALLAIVASTGLGMLAAHAQTAPPREPQTQLPRQSAPQPSTTGRAQPQAPVGHRQPRAADVPNQGQITIAPGDAELDHLQICRGC